MTNRPTAWTVVALVAWLFAGCIVVQVFLAGLGVFDSASAFITHRNFGYLFGWLSLVLLVVAAVGRMPRRLIGLAGLTLVQMALQSVLILFRDENPAIAALHPVNGVLLLVTTLVLGWLAWSGRRRSRALGQMAQDEPARVGMARPEGFEPPTY